MNDPEFYLKFIEGFHDEETRFCWRIKQITIGIHPDNLLVRVNPTCAGLKYGFDIAEINFLIVTPKYQQTSLFPVSDWPLNVYVFLPIIIGPEFRDVLASHEVKKIAFGQISLDGKSRTYASGPYVINPR